MTETHAEETSARFRSQAETCGSRPSGFPTRKADALRAVARRNEAHQAARQDIIGGSIGTKSIPLTRTDINDYLVVAGAVLGVVVVPVAGAGLELVVGVVIVPVVPVAGVVVVGEVIVPVVAAGAFLVAFLAAFLGVMVPALFAVHLARSLTVKVAGSIVSVPTTRDLYLLALSTTISPQLSASFSLREYSLLLVLVTLTGYFLLTVKPVTTTWFLLVL